MSKGEGQRLVALLAAALWSLACSQSPGGGPSGGGSADQGKQLLTSKGCIACHTVKEVPGASGTIGPPLDGLGNPASRPKIAAGLLDNNAENLKRWLANPPAVKPDTVMPNLSLAAGEIESLVAFLQTLK